MYIKSKIIRSPHGFCTRNGGVSTLEHTQSLNLAFGRGDDDTVVLQNLSALAKAVGFAPESVISLPQIHSDIIYKVGRRDAGQGYFLKNNIRSGDGYVTNELGVTLGVKTADCVPILFEAEKDGKIVAVGAVHAGWRGTVAKIQQKCVRLLCEEYGVQPSDVRAAIGPCIHSCCYEVGEDLFCQVQKSLGNNIAHRFVTPSPNAPSKYLCDLPETNRFLLNEAGVPIQNIETISHCTCCEPDLFYSHRYSKGVRGTMLNFIFLK